VGFFLRVLEISIDLKDSKICQPCNICHVGTRIELARFPGRPGSRSNDKLRRLPLTDGRARCPLHRTDESRSSPPSTNDELNSAVRARIEVRIT